MSMVANQETGAAEAPTRFVGAVARLERLKADDLASLNFTVDPSLLGARTAGIFDWNGGNGEARSGLSVVA